MVLVMVAVDEWMNGGGGGGGGGGSSMVRSTISTVVGP